MIIEEHNEFLNALKALRDRVYQCQVVALEARDKIGAVVSDSHLRSTLTMLKSDIVLKEILNK